MKPAPPWLDDESALVLIDWSGWLHKAFAIGGIESMVSMVIGWLTGHVLAYRPAHLAIAIDSGGETHRHRAVHPTDEAWRYKGNRPPKPRDFYDLAERCTQIAEMHAIPVLWAREREADDVIATATAQARAAGYRVWICSADKDLCALVDADEQSGIVVGTWDNFAEIDHFRGPAEVVAKFGVQPSQMTDYLAIVGDTSDGIPGVQGLGGVAAADILAAWGTLEGALAAVPWPEVQYTAADKERAALAKRLKITSEPDKRAEIEQTREKIMVVKRLAKAHSKLVAAAELARFSRTLVALDCGAPLRIPWRELPIGGFDVEALRAAYLNIGMSAKAHQVPEWRKRAPYVVPFEADAA